jgi:hypothetical protein
MYSDPFYVNLTFCFSSEAVCDNDTVSRTPIFIFANKQDLPVKEFLLFRLYECSYLIYTRVLFHLEN